MANELKPCPFCGSTNLDCGFMTGTLKGFDYVACEDCGGEIHAIHMSRGVINATDLWNRRAKGGAEMTEDEMMRKYAEAHGVTDYPQAHEKNEYRYLSPAWLDEIAKGLTAGQEKYPGETWRQIPAREHAWRAVRHLILFLKGDKADTHLINAAMRTMMAFETDAAANDVIEWEKLMREKGCG